MFFQVAMFTVAGEHLTLRMRKMAFAAMLKQEMGWFDQPNNNTGALCSRLSADAAAIQGVSHYSSEIKRFMLDEMTQSNISKNLPYFWNMKIENPCSLFIILFYYWIFFPNEKGKKNYKGHLIKHKLLICDLWS